MSLSLSRFDEILKKFDEIKPVIVIGDVGVDKYTYGSVSRISPEAPVPVLAVSKEWEKLGLAANVSDNLKSLGVDSTLCGVIGDDKNGSSLESLLEHAELKTWGITRAPNRMTTYKERVVTGIQQICRVDYESNEELDAGTFDKVASRLKDFLPEHSAVIIEDYGKGLVSEKLLSFITTECKGDEKLIAVDPSRTTPPLWYKGVHLLKPNRVEAELMVKALGYHEKVSVEKMANILCDKLSLKKVIITLGAEGMALLDTDDGKVKVIPTVASEVFDVSGAGDTAISAIVASLEAGANLEEAAWVGNCASGVVVGKKGTARVTREELIPFFQKLS